MKQERYLAKSYVNRNHKYSIAAEQHYVFLLIYDPCTIFSSGTEVLCPSGSLYVMRPETTATILCSGVADEPFAAALFVTPETLEEISESNVKFIDELANVPAAGMRCSIYCATFAISKNLVDNLNALQFTGYEYGRNVYIKGILSILMVYFVRAVRNDATILLKGGESAVSLEAVSAYISKHITEEITLEMLANEFFIDKSYLNRKFKEATGMTLHRYIIRTKLQLCQQYIVKGVPLSQVYSLVGIGGYNNFFRAFKREFG
ncbi:MAG: AraC family transcriptional regulator, partial [Oscillospiraceae bacterium]|nr:AraC family transcriptional regulator [Oscillospiraceae bacterium]